MEPFGQGGHHATDGGQDCSLFFLGGGAAGVSSKPLLFLPARQRTTHTHRRR